MAIDLNLRKLREKENISQVELAGKVGVTQEFISFVEKGYRLPGIEVAKRLADALNVSVDDLIK